MPPIAITLSSTGGVAIQDLQVVFGWAGTCRMSADKCGTALWGNSGTIPARARRSQSRCSYAVIRRISPFPSHPKTTFWISGSRWSRSKSNFLWNSRRNPIGIIIDCSADSSSRSACTACRSGDSRGPSDRCAACRRSTPPCPRSSCRPCRRGRRTSPAGTGT